MKNAKIFLCATLLLLAVLTGCSQGGSENSNSPSTSILPPTSPTEGKETEVPATPIDFDISTADKIVVIQSRETQTAWEATDAEVVSQLVDFVSGLKYRTPQQGGYAGEFLLVKFYAQDTELGVVHFASSDQIQSSVNSTSYLYPIQEGGWSGADWERFLEKCTEKT